MIARIKDIDQLVLPIKTQGFIINLNHQTKTVELHKTNCKDFAKEKIAKNDFENKLWEMWFSEKYRDACSKAVEVAIEKDYRYTPCATCIVNEQNWKLVSICNLISK